MKNTRLLILAVATIIGILAPFPTSADSKTAPLGLFHDYAAWQEFIPTSFANAPHFYLYLSGKNYSNKTWKTKEEQSSDEFLYRKVVLVSSPLLGYFVYTETNTPSGDWYLVEEAYYDAQKKLIFLDWGLNTFKADEPLSVTKRFLVNTGKITATEVLVTKMNTDVPTDAGYADREVDLLFDLSDAEFLK